MTTRRKSAKSNQRNQPVLAPILDGRGLPLPEQAPLTHPDPALLHLVPQDAGAEVTLARVENLLGKGHFGAALREAQPPIELADQALAGRYEFIRQEKLSRAQIGIADRYFLRGDRESARQFYERALEPETNDPGVKEVAELAGKVFDDLTSSRRELIGALRADAQAGNFTEWCGRKKTLTDVTILDVGPVRERIYPDFRLETVFGQRPPLIVEPGYLDPLPAETELVAFTSAVPGTIFRAATAEAVDIDLPQPEVPGDPPGDRFRASLAFPVVANVFIAKLGLFAIDQGLSVTGQADGVVPLFRYEYLRDQAKELIAQVQGIEFADAADPVPAGRLRRGGQRHQAAPRRAAGGARGGQAADRRADPGPGRAGPGRAGAGPGDRRPRRGRGAVRVRLVLLARHDSHISGRRRRRSCFGRRPRHRPRPVVRACRAAFRPGLSRGSHSSPTVSSPAKTSPSSAEA